MAERRLITYHFEMQTVNCAFDRMNIFKAEPLSFEMETSEHIGCLIIEAYTDYITIVILTCINDQATV